MRVSISLFTAAVLSASRASATAVNVESSAPNTFVVPTPTTAASSSLSSGASQNTTTAITKTWDWSTWNLAPTGTGADYASRCDAAKSSWSQLSSYSTGVHTYPGSLSYQVFEFYSTSVSYDGLYTTCGLTRAKSRFSTASLTSTSVSTATITGGSYTGADLVYPSPKPLCDYGQDECNKRWTEHAQATESWSKSSTAGVLSLSMANPPNSIVFQGTTTTLVSGPVTAAPVLTLGTRTITPSLYTWPNSTVSGTIVTKVITAYYIEGPSYKGIGDVTIAPGQSTTWTATKPYPEEPSCRPQLTAGNGGGKCSIRAYGEAKLLYYPVAPSSRTTDACALTPTQGPLTGLPNVWPTPAPTQGPILNATRVTVSGTVLDPRSVYLSYDTLLAYDGSHEIGYEHTNGLVAFDPAHFVTQRLVASDRGRLIPVPYQMSVADLNAPIPLSVYHSSASYCDKSSDPFSCTVLADNDYHPLLAVPPEARTIDPAWASCEVGDGVIATPQPITRGMVLAKPTHSSSSSWLAPASRTSSGPDLAKMTTLSTSTKTM